MHRIIEDVREDATKCRVKTEDMTEMWRTNRNNHRNVENIQKKSAKCREQTEEIT